MLNKYLLIDWLRMDGSVYPKFYFIKLISVGINFEFEISSWKIHLCQLTNHGFNRMFLHAFTW
jgi:hypothetical protein